MLSFFSPQCQEHSGVGLEWTKRPFRHFGVGTCHGIPKLQSRQNQGSQQDAEPGVQRNVRVVSARFGISLCVFLSARFRSSAITHRLPQQAWIHFVVMDHDFLMTNDYAGEAFLSFNEVPGATHAPVEKTGSTASISGSAGHLQKQFTLALMHPDHASKCRTMRLDTHMANQGQAIRLNDLPEAPLGFQMSHLSPSLEPEKTIEKPKNF